MRPIVLRKYGGSSVATMEKMKRVAESVAELSREKRVVVVVSAMGGTTDHLLSLAKEANPEPPSRELDMLLSVGERISMSILAMALHSLGVEAVSFTGSQSGIITNDAHSGARIIEVRPFRILDELDQGKVVIVAGFQGMSYRREITTLGRGGSDTTAVALAAALDAEYCEILSDVDGVLSADPRTVGGAMKLDEISYEEMQEMAEHGAKVLNAQAVEFAKEKNIAIYARLAHPGPGEPPPGTGGTIVRRNPPISPGRVRGVAFERGLVMLSVTGASSGEALTNLLIESGIMGKEIRIHGSGDTEGASAVFSLDNIHDFPRFERLAAESLRSGFRMEKDLGAVSLIGAGINDTPANLSAFFRIISKAGSPIHTLTTSSFRITAVIPGTGIDKIVQDCHAELIERAEPVP